MLSLIAPVAGVVPYKPIAAVRPKSAPAAPALIAARRRS